MWVHLWPGVFQLGLTFDPVWLDCTADLIWVQRWRNSSSHRRRKSNSINKGRTSSSETQTSTFHCFISDRLSSAAACWSLPWLYERDYLCTIECRHEDEGGVWTWTWLNSSQSVESCADRLLQPRGEKSCILRRLKESVETGCQLAWY